MQGKFGGKTRTSGQGRPKGALNKATADIKALAKTYTPAAFKELARLALKAESEAARVAAIKEILDRGYGKAHTTISGPNDGPVQIEHLTPEQRAAQAVALIDETFGGVIGVSKGTETIQ